MKQGGNTCLKTTWKPLGAHALVFSLCQPLFNLSFWSLMLSSFWRLTTDSWAPAFFNCKPPSHSASHTWYHVSPLRWKGWAIKFKVQILLWKEGLAVPSVPREFTVFTIYSYVCKPKRLISGKAANHVRKIKLWPTLMSQSVMNNIRRDVHSKFLWTWTNLAYDQLLASRHLVFLPSKRQQITSAYISNASVDSKAANTRL